MEQAGRNHHPSTPPPPPFSPQGTAFTASERERLKLRGLLPPGVSTMASQAARFLDEFHNGVEYVDPEQIDASGITPDAVRQWRALQDLQDRNEELFFHVLTNNFEAMAPVVYTPVVGWAAVNFHRIYRRPRGLYVSAEDGGGCISTCVWNWPQREVDAIVLTDGSRILGLGDLGANGLAIPIGKLNIYCAAAGFHPARVLPIVLDVGTDNSDLRADPAYMGLRRRRLRGDDLFELLDELVVALTTRWPRAVLQFEDFSTEHALAALSRWGTSKGGGRGGACHHPLSPSLTPPPPFSVCSTLQIPRTPPHIQ